MKIAILGGGTSSAITICTFISELNRRNLNINGFEFTCIFDPKIDTLQVGESISPYISTLLKEVIGYEYNPDNLFFNESLRKGTKVFWNKANGKDSIVNYSSPGLHVDSSLFSNFVLNTLTSNYNCVKVIHDNINTVDQDFDRVKIIGNNNVYTFDFIIDCRGFPSNEEIDSDLYSRPSHEFVNSVVIYPDFKEYNEDFTDAYVHENGWMFGVPLKHRKAFGYCYNNKLLTQEDAVSNFSKLININPDKLRHLSWHQYYRNKVIDNRICYNGNKLYFFEPHQGLPLHYYYCIASYIINSVVEINRSNKTLLEVNRMINNYHAIMIEQLEVLIALNYAGYNKIDSPFWQQAILNSRGVIKNSLSMFDWYVNRNEAIFLDKPFDQRYGTHDTSLLTQYLQSYDIKLDNIFV